MTAEEKIIENTWKGIPNFKCPKCAFSSLRKYEVLAHMSAVHNIYSYVENRLEEIFDDLPPIEEEKPEQVEEEAPVEKEKASPKKKKSRKSGKGSE